MPPSRSNVVTLATTSGASWLDRSANGGKTWVVEEVKDSGGGPPLNSLSYVSPTVGWVVLGQPARPIGRSLTGYCGHRTPASPGARSASEQGRDQELRALS